MREYDEGKAYDELESVRMSTTRTTRTAVVTRTAMGTTAERPDGGTACYCKHACMLAHAHTCAPTGSGTAGRLQCCTSGHGFER